MYFKRYTVISWLEHKVTHFDFSFILVFLLGCLIPRRFYRRGKGVVSDVIKNLENRNVYMFICLTKTRRNKHISWMHVERLEGDRD